MIISTVTKKWAMGGVCPTRFKSVFGWFIGILLLLAEYAVSEICMLSVIFGFVSASVRGIVTSMITWSDIELLNAIMDSGTLPGSGRLLQIDQTIFRITPSYRSFSASRSLRFTGQRYGEHWR